MTRVFSIVLGKGLFPINVQLKFPNVTHATFKCIHPCSLSSVQVNTNHNTKEFHFHQLEQLFLTIETIPLNRYYGVMM